jgi:hypothetical protein
MSKRDDLNAARGIARGIAYSVVIWVALIVLLLLASCSTGTYIECERYTMQGECERSFFQPGDNHV